MNERFAPASGSLARRVTALFVDVVSGPRRGRSFEFSRHESFVVGRPASCQLRLEGDPHISRFHFRLEVNPPDARVVDLDSSNGILVNGRPAKTAELREGDEVSAGQTTLRVRYGMPCVQESLDETVHWPASPVPVASHGAANSATAKLELPRYELQDEVGRGSLGTVHRAVEKATGRRVSVKVIPCRDRSTRTPRGCCLTRGGHCGG